MGGQSHPTPQPITIRQLAGLDEFHHFEQAQREVWGMSDLEVIPSHLLLTIAKNGGLVLGAFDGERMVGVLCGFLGQDAMGLKHCSHIMGVVPEYRARGVGSALKWAQREAVLAQGLDRVTWTYDPLETPNARLNLHVLGAVCRRYRPDLYGELKDALNAGLPTDRFEVDWWVASPRVAGRAGRPVDPPVGLPQAANRITPAGADPWPRPEGWRMPDGSETSVIVPADFRALRSADLGLARAWRFHTRELFTALFQAGFVASDFVVERKRQARYLLEKQGEGTPSMS